MIQSNWKDYFSFSKKEVKGIIVLGFILFGSILLSRLFSSKSMSTLIAKQDRKIRLIVFDPNTVDSIQALDLGIPEKQVRTLLRYRAKGGYFKQKQDFSKLYGLTTEMYNSLSPYIKIGPSAKPSYARFSNYRPYGSSNKPEKPNWTIDINAALEQEWERKTNLPLDIIGRVLAYKKYLGAFTKPSQLSKVYGLSDSMYQFIRPHIVIDLNKAPAMNMNTMRFNEWKNLGMFTDRQIWTLLKLKKENGGRIDWLAIIEATDLTEGEANLLKKKLRLSD
jgi:DNA uptake protein ComE-like DNA-binding protein